MNETKSRRIRSGLNATEVEQLFGYSKRVVEKWEFPDATTPTRATKLAYFYSLDSLFGEVIGILDDYPELAEKVPKEHSQYVVFRLFGGQFHYYTSYDRIYGHIREILSQIREAHLFNKEANYIVVDSQNLLMSREEIENSNYNLYKVVAEKIKSHQQLL